MSAAPDPLATSAIERHSASFALAARLLAPEVRARARQLYAVCRHLDDLADRPEAGADPAVRLAALAARPWSAGTPDPLERALACLVADGIGGTALRQLIRGVAGDVGRVALADERALVRYAYRVAGTVGLMMCDVLGVEAPADRLAAVDLGIAMQLTNVARDVVEDARAGRRYLPASLIDLPPAALACPDARTRALAAPAVLRLIAMAEPRYDRAAAAIGRLPPRARPGIAVATSLYRAIGRRIAARGGDIAEPKVALSPFARLRIAGTAILGTGPGRGGAGHPDDPDPRLADLVASGLKGGARA